MKYFETTDTQWSHYNGREIVEVEPMDPGAYDAEEVGPMFYARFADGDYVEAFADEIRTKGETCDNCASQGIPYDPDRHDSENCWVGY